MTRLLFKVIAVFHFIFFFHSIAYSQSKKSQVYCNSLFEKFTNKAGLSMTAMGEANFAVIKCAEQWMNEALDKRLLKIKKIEPKQFKTEMAIQKEFNLAVTHIASTIQDNCDGSLCITCTPQKELFYYRASQAEQINETKLSLSAASITKKSPKKIIDSFKKFADGLCAMPVKIWFKKKVPDKCQEMVFREITKALDIYVNDSGALECQN